MYSHDHNLCIALMIIDSMLELPDVGIEADPISGKINVSYLQTLNIHSHCLVMYQVGGGEGGTKPGHLQEAA